MKRLLALLINERPFTAAGEWQQLAPYGIHAHPLGRQKLDKERAARVVAALNSAKSRAGDDWRGVPIFVGHPPERGGDPAQKGQKFPRIGGVMECEARADGLWGKVAWNNLGTENAREGHFIYPSPAWYFDKEGSGVISPNELDHIGMTNTPNIESVKPWTNESDSEPDNDEHTMKKEHIARLKAALKLNDDADDEAVCNAVDSTVAAVAANEAKVTEATTLATNEKTAKAALEAQLATEKTAREAAVNEAAAAKAAHAKTLLDVAVNEGRISAAERVTHEAAFTADFAAACNALAAITKPKHDTKPTVIDLRGARKSIAAANERAEIIQTAVNEIMQREKVDYSTAYARVKADKQFAPVFAAMEQPKAG